MKNKILGMITHPLISGSTILLLGSILANVSNYVFNLAMGNMLSASEYGVFASLMSIFNILAVFSSTVMMVFAKFAASFIGRKREDLIGMLFKKGSVWVASLSLIICITTLLFSSMIGKFLNISDIFLINLVIFSLFFVFISSVGYGILQGLLRFGFFSFINIASSLLKLILGFVLVYFSFKTFGAVLAFFCSAVLGYVLIFIPLKKYLKPTKKQVLEIPNLKKEISVYALPVFLSGIGMIAFNSLDVILVKHFFNEITAGQYAALSLMGRSIFYLISPVITVSFSLIAQKKEKEESLTGTLLLAFFLVGMPSVLLSIIYSLFPGLILGIFFPAPVYSSLSQYLGLYSVFIVFFLFSWLLNNFYLSIGKTKAFFFTITGAILETIGIILFHQNISQIIYVLIGVSFLLLLSLLLYYPYTLHRK